MDRQGAKVRLPGGTEIACTAKKVSKSGARIGRPRDVALPEAFRLQMIGYDFLFEIRRIWHNGGSMSLRIDRVGKYRPPAPLPAKDAPKPQAATAEHASLGTRRSRFSSL